MSGNRPAISLMNGYAPNGGGRGLGIDFDFRGTNSRVELDLLLEQTEGNIEIIQAVWADNTSNPNALVLQFGITNQFVKVPPYTQGVFPVYVGGITKIIATTVAGGEVAVLPKIILLNMPQPYFIWSPNVVGGGGGGGGGAIPAVYADKSGFIAVGGTAQTLAAANPARRGLMVQNNSVGDLWFNSMAAAIIGQPSFRLGPGEWYIATSPDVAVTAYSIIGATINQTYSAREW